MFILMIASAIAMTGCGSKSSTSSSQGSEQGAKEQYYYTCTMHPEVHQDKPGKCPVCGMDLVKKEGTYHPPQPK